MIAQTYNHLINLPSTGLRFFTVYGPWGRPNMAPIIFNKSTLNKESIKVFNNGYMSRDFTYIDDFTNGIFKFCSKPGTILKAFYKSNPDPSTSYCTS